MRAAIIALMMMFGSPAGAECGNLCDWGWWETATEADVEFELGSSMHPLARNKDGETQLQIRFYSTAPSE